jgi:3-hydroxyacyl-CoA dehydrogenase/enoyl-CoA hydratase/3-hydroxybutyryl-CoA epimerase/3-hydroxyacyl-CoA dehydrogenase/enoyl-CoA hydratase/3-hydroxybutyryl-CoA epimerase/enoyl-CoA isomerase
VAAIEGACVGGGAELASWCDRRVFSKHPKTQFGFPEVKLGLFPGWGGTVRAPRIVGLANAVEMICTGESLDARQAAAMGWASDVVPPDRLLDAAVALVREEQATRSYLRDRERWNQPVEMNPTELGFLFATASGQIQQETKGHYPAPSAALAVLGEGSQLDVDAALAKEAEGMAQLFGTPENRALINVFFLTDRNKRDSGLEKPAEARPIHSVGIIGAGIMGAGIAAATVKSETVTTLLDASAEALAKGARGVIEEVAYDRKTKKADADRALRFAPLLHSATSDADLADCDLVVEAIIEKEEPKKQLYAQLEPLLKPGAMLVSNTSTLPITKLAASLKAPDRFAGLHFFNPVRRMKLVEVIRGQATSDDTVASLVAFAKRIGKMPIVVGDGPGFLVNRLLFPYMNEAIELIQDGVGFRDIDKAAFTFGMPMGPLVLYDMVGLDTAMYAGRTMWEAFPDRVVASPLVPSLVKAGRLGQKSGKGFYSYDNKKGTPQDDPAAEKLVAVYRRGEAQLSREQITQRLFLPMVLEATRALQEGIARDVRDIDLGMIFGLGFPPFRGGLLFWADTLGAAKIVEMLKPWEALGKRFQPTERLLDMARTGAKFYG